MMHSRIIGNSATVTCEVNEDTLDANDKLPNPEETSLVRTIIKKTLDNQGDWSQHIKD